MQLLSESATTKATATTTATPSSGATTTTANANTTAPAAGGNMDKFHPPKPKISAFNELFKCQLCQGYMINPTTIDACMHTYCRSCIARHLAVDCYCPQCKGNGGKALTISNLKSDDVLRSIIFKLVPGLYQKERERIVQFVNNTKNEAQFSGSDNSVALQQTAAPQDVLETDDDFFSPTEPISLSLEYHPYLAKQCPESAVPPVRYLQCPASVKIVHLKRFLCSKFDIDPSNRRVGIEIIYEDEVLPSDFSLMDVGYCYQWKRHSPLKFFYRILIYSEEQFTSAGSDNSTTEQVSNKSSNTYVGPAVPKTETSKSPEKSPLSGNGDSPTGTPADSPFLSPAPLTTKVKSSKSSSSKHAQSLSLSSSSSSLSSSSSSSSSTPSVKMTITSTRPVESKKSVSKRSSATEDFVLPTTNDFKSLRSNDIRYSHYAVTATTTSPPSAPTPAAAVASTKAKTKASVTVKEEKPPKCDIVVSIPHNQMQDEWESKPLSQLKTASKKSPNPPTGSNTSTANVVDSTSAVQPKKVKNVPKLKIELNSLKTKLIEKPKSADIRLDTLMLKHHKPRKFSLDESQQVNEKVDLETYVKNIGLKPIEVQTVATPESDVTGKFTPNASPRSSCSSSTTSSSNGYLHVVGDISTSSSSSHKKRKKKHSKEPRDSKRKKLHAEISSHTDEESLKMKVKLTAPLNIKPSKFESKKSPSAEKPQNSLDFEKGKSSETKTKIIFEKPLMPSSKPREGEKEKCKSMSDKSHRDALKLKPLAIKTSCKEFEDDDDIVIPDTTTTSLSASFSKPLTNLKDSKLPHSPPLPPSLFKTTPLTFSTFTPNVITVAKPKTAPIPPKQVRDKPVQTPKMKPLAPKPMPVKYLPAPMKPPQFAVPNLPRLMPSTSSKFLTSTPSSIASAANKQMGNLLKRSISLDEAKAGAKLSKIEKPPQITVSAYGSNLQVTRVEVPATPTSSTAKATFEIPLYSPLSASYNPKCSFTVGSTSTATMAKGPKANLPLSLNSSVPSTPSGKSSMFTTSAAIKKPEKELKKVTTSAGSIASTTHTVAKTSPVMGPPLSIAKLNTVVPATIKSPPLAVQQSAPHTVSAAPPVTLNSRLAADVLPTNSVKSTTPTTNGPLTVEKPKSSLRQFRLPSRESGQDILDLSSAPKSMNGLQAAEKKLTTSPTIPASPTTTAGSSLELALSKIKQNINSGVCQDNKPNTLDLKPNSDDLQNLHLLSESATAREKIAINSPTSAGGTTSLYEKPKINQNSLVRQQNASVRNIPNPSALAFRNHQPTNNIPMVTIAAPLVASLTNDADKPLLCPKTPSSPHSPLSVKPQSPNYSTSSTSTTSPARTTTTTTVSSKRHPSIDQVAASLNMRASAAAAAEASAKASLKQLDETAVVTSTSSMAEIGGGNKLKQIKQEAVEQTTTAPMTVGATATVSMESVRPTTTVHSTATTSSDVVVEIKKEPEDRFNDNISSPVDEQRDVKTVLATTTASAFSVAMAAAAAAAAVPSSSSSASTSKVENLVTSVINVSTPTSTLLAASGGGF